MKAGTQMGKKIAGGRVVQFRLKDQTIGEIVFLAQVRGVSQEDLVTTLLHNEYIAYAREIQARMLAQKQRLLADEERAQAQARQAEAEIAGKFPAAEVKEG